VSPEADYFYLRHRTGLRCKSNQDFGAQELRWLDAKWTKEVATGALLVELDTERRAKKKRYTGCLSKFRQHANLAMAK